MPATAVGNSREEQRGRADAFTHLCVVKFEAGEFEVLEHLDVRVPHQEVAVLLGPALLEGPVLTALDTPAFHHPEIQYIGHIEGRAALTDHSFCELERREKRGDSPGGHHNEKYHLLPHHAPEVTKGFWQRT